MVNSSKTGSNIMHSIMNEHKVVLIDLKDDLNTVNYDFVLHLTPKDIDTLGLVENLLEKHFKRPWVYTGSEIPREPKAGLLHDIEKSGLDDEEKQRIRGLVTEKKLPAEVLLVLEGGREGGLHNHAVRTSGNLQLEQYMVPDGKDMIFRFMSKKKLEELKIVGPSVLLVGNVNHDRYSGECFIVKFPSGEFKNIV